MQFIKFLRSGSGKHTQTRKGFQISTIQQLGKLLMELGGFKTPAHKQETPTLAPQLDQTSGIPDCRGFKMACLNITSLPKHIDELRSFLHNNCCLDILAINETRLHEIISSDNEIRIEGYDIVRRDRLLNGRNGGGVCFYICTCINYVVCKDLEFSTLENLAIEITKPRAKPIIISTWYRPPNSPSELFGDSEAFVGRLDTEGKEYYIISDLNCNMLPTSCSNINTQTLLNITDIYNLKQLISESTRITPSSSTLIDVIFASHPNNILCSGVSHISISDHSLVYAYRKISLPPPTKGINNISYRKFKNFDAQSFRADIAVQPWDELMRMENTNRMWLKWKSLFLEVCDKHAPIRIKRVRASRTPWINNDLKKIMYQRDRLKKIASITKNP